MSREIRRGSVAEQLKNTRSKEREEYATIRLNANRPRCDEPQSAVSYTSSCKGKGDIDLEEGTLHVTHVMKSLSGKSWEI